jgi:hypothetical protein
MPMTSRLPAAQPGWTLKERTNTATAAPTRHDGIAARAAMWRILVLAHGRLWVRKRSGDVLSQKSGFSKNVRWEHQDMRDLSRIAAK